MQVSIPSAGAATAAAADMGGFDTQAAVYGVRCLPADTLVPIIRNVCVANKEIDGSLR
jgi:hypothetical protein